MTTVEKQYSPFFKGWQAKVLGGKPEATALTVAHAFGRPGKQSLALAMAMRPEGVSGAQIVMACGAPQNNHRRDLLGSGYFKRNAMPPNAHGHTVYQITLTPKGEAAMKRRAENEAKATLATDAPKPAKVKAAKRKAKAVKVPVTDTDVPASVPVNDAPAADQPTA